MKRCIFSYNIFHLQTDEQSMMTLLTSFSSKYIFIISLITFSLKFPSLSTYCRKMTITFFNISIHVYNSFQVIILVIIPTPLNFLIVHSMYDKTFSSSILMLFSLTSSTISEIRIKKLIRNIIICISNYLQITLINASFISAHCLSKT